VLRGNARVMAGNADAMSALACLEATAHGGSQPDALHLARHALTLAPLSATPRFALATALAAARRPSLALLALHAAVRGGTGCAAADVSSRMFPEGVPSHAGTTRPRAPAWDPDLAERNAVARERRAWLAGREAAVKGALRHGP
jgi:hypothetical protein